MIRRGLEVSLIDPVIASFDVATAAVPTSLPYLPGAMLWGVLAHRAYGSAKPAGEVLDWLYGGGLLVGDAWLAVEGDVALPVPMSFHRDKDSGELLDLTTDQRKAGCKQQRDKQIRPGEGGGDYAEAAVATVATRRTSINPDTLRASDGHFYSLQALAAGQRFVAWIEGPQDQVDWAIEALSGQHLLGRSRMAEFGRAQIRPVDPPTLPETGDGGARYLWCLSDLAGLDAHFTPTERPERLLGAQIDWSRSFVRHRTYAPFNATWGRRQSERLVIARGSVLTLDTDVPAGLHRAGLWQEQGLGLMLALAAPPREVLRSWSRCDRRQPQGAQQGAQQGASRDVAETDLYRLLQRWAKTKDEQQKLNASAARVWDEWCGRYRAAERLQGERCGPTASQWAALAQMPDADIRPFLERARESGGAKEILAWRAAFAIGDEGTFAGKALAILVDEGAVALKRLAKALRDSLKREGWFDAK